MDKKRLLQLFEEVLSNWEKAQDYVIQDTQCFGDENNHLFLEEDIKEYRRKFLEALES